MEPDDIDEPLDDIDEPLDDLPDDDIDLDLPDEPELEPDEPPVRQPSRSQARIEALDREAKEAKAEADLLRRQLNEVLSGTSRSEAEARQRQRQQELEAMDPWDRAEALNSDREARIRGELGAVTRKLQDSTDRAEFAAKCASEPKLAKIADEVEARLAEARSKGIDVQRETLATFILGEKSLKSKARARAERKASDNLSRERTRPAGGSSDAPRPQGKDERAAYEKRVLSYKF